MVKKILSILAWIVTAAALVALFVVGRKHYLERPVKAINVSIDRATDSGFVKKHQVLADIQGIIGNAQIGTVNMAAIGKALKANPWIDSSSSYIDLDGVLNVNIKEYQPVLRVFGKNGVTAYISADNKVLPTNAGHTPYVLIANGNFDLDADHLVHRLCDTVEADRNILSAIKILNAIDNNTFIRNCVGQLYCNGKNEFELVVRSLDARILLGDTCNIDDKLRRLEIFMKQKANGSEISTLKQIDLKYKNQIVCTKR